MKTIKVLYNKELVGYCLWDDKQGVTKFNYDLDFIKKGYELSPIVMPLADKIYESNPREAIETFKNLPPLLADALPDAFGNKVITEFFLQKGIKQSELNPIQRLSFLSNRGMGALEFEPAYERENANNLIHIEELLQVVNDIYFKKEEVSKPLNDYSQNLDTLLHIGSSAGGARAKALLAINEETNEIKAGDIYQGKDFEYYLIKFDGLSQGNMVEPKGYGIIEYIYSELAKKSGINMTDCRLYQENGRSHFITKRFDRGNNGEKIHIQTVCGLTGIDFNQQGIFSYETLMKITQMMTNDKKEVENMYRRMVFNVVGLNNDDHIKNFSFMMKDGKWGLSPAYDMTFSYDPNHHWLKRHSITINGKMTDINLSDLLEIGEQFNITNSRDIIKQTMEVFQEFPNLAQKYNLNRAITGKISDILIDNMNLMEKNNQKLRIK